ncbi:hypothetical protein BDV38DRAFT_272710 [Aspergillus pseudotamarii]|uniref:Arrestin-like N-terminal domain-containing protein n=1 Tax=Aspergillus pseudotamarii TaxID=132259 RepID=A0A5N6SNM9_ASPPS|nr:uncharacterized protein BDV38DRAFT_272710 [Aspergillus pseudotamarii]KAE8135517.1 hypothetical protein BDV38DRAFT_272710 [Aspergillus pseudotamarii]
MSRTIPIWSLKGRILSIGLVPSQNGQPAFAEFVVETDDDTSVVSMERFKPLLKSVHCSNASLAVNFKNQKSFEYTKRAWKWVNEIERNTLIVVAGTGQCGWNTHRVPFAVSKIEFDDHTKTAKLQARRSEWKDVFHSFELSVGRVAKEEVYDTCVAPQHMKRKEHEKTLTMSFDHPWKLPQKDFSTPEDAFSLTLSCDQCGTKGSFELGFYLRNEKHIPKAATFTLTPHGVSTRIGPKLTLSGDFTEEYSQQFDLAKIPIYGYSIPGVLDLGPEIVFSLGFSVGPVSGSASISSGIDISLLDSAELKIDLLSPHVVHSGWTPQVRTEPVKVDAQIEAGVNIYAKAAIQLAAVALGHGFEAGVNLKPVLGATLSLSESTAGACVNDEKHHVFGVSVAPSAGVSLNAEITRASDKGNPLAKLTIADLKEAIPDACVGFGPVVANSSLPAKRDSSGMASNQSDTDSLPTASSSQVHRGYHRRHHHHHHHHHHGRRH